MANDRVPIRVVIADDQEQVRSSFTVILDAQPDIEVVAAVSNGAEAVRAARTHAPDVVLLDVRMPVMDGLQAAREICAAGSGRVLMLTTFDVDDYVYDALRAGASGFLLKDVRREELARAVRLVAAGEALLAPSVTRRLIEDRIRHDSRTVTAAHAALAGQLTSRETEILSLLARGMSNSEIAAELVISPHTVKTHVKSVLAKLQLRDRVHAVVFALET